jgi:group I intron endonuclease
MNNNNNNNIKIELVSPVIKYTNSEELKSQVLKDNKGKSGIYRWVNNLNGNTYVGSAVNLEIRLRSYYNIKELKRNSRPIKDALLKYGHSNFTLEILEYCPIISLTEREQFYMDLLIPEYNILKNAYSLLGFKHSQETILKLKEKVISPEHKKILSSIHIGKVVNEDTRNKLAAATANYRKRNPLSEEALENLRVKTTLREGVAVTVLNTETNEIKSFTNQTEAGVFLGISRQAVYNAIKRGSIVNGVYIINKV